MAVNSQMPMGEYDIEAMRIKMGFWTIFAGFALTGMTLLIAVSVWQSHMDGKNVASGDVVAIIGSITGIVGTVIGTFFGVHVGSAGRAQAELARDRATQTAMQLAGAADSQKAGVILGVSHGTVTGQSDPSSTVQSQSTTVQTTAAQTVTSETVNAPV